jgi:hypothetical protein
MSYAPNYNLLNHKYPLLINYATPTIKGLGFNQNRQAMICMPPTQDSLPGLNLHLYLLTLI